MNPINAEEARVIRTWRVDLGCSWSRVAELWDKAFPDRKFIPRDGGMLCQWAAQTLNEAPGEEPWN
jgi:hypothetical protein